jgi:hypothetical protein
VGSPLAKIWELPVLGVLNGLRRRRLLAWYRSTQNEVANMLPLELQEFSLDPNGSNSRDASRTDGVNRSIWILSMSEFGTFSRHD